MFFFYLFIDRIPILFSIWSLLGVIYNFPEVMFWVAFLFLKFRLSLFKFSSKCSILRPIFISLKLFSDDEEEEASI